MFCRNCGKELTGTPEICLGCGARPLVGTSFCSACGAETNPLAEICIKCGVRLVKAGAVDISPKSRLVTTLTVFFVGTLGVHRFYLGKIETALPMLLLTIVGYILMVVGVATYLWGISVFGYLFIIAVGIWAFIDFIFAVSGNMRDKEGKLIKNW